jgi:Carbohydrate esterase, sialic acid-specific acetylesterase
MKRTSSRFFLSAILFGAASLAALGTLSACGGDDSSSPSRPSPSSDGGLDAEASVQDDAKADAPPKEAGTEAAPDALPDGELDSDGDGVPDSEDVCPGSDDSIDGDGDGIPDGCDTCPTGNNDLDSDGDGFADGCDICPGFNESIDTNGSGVPDCREALKLWLRASDDVYADDGTGAVGAPAMDGDPVRQWRDQGVWSSHGAQTDPNRQPKFVQTALPSGGPAVRFEGTTEDTVNDDSLDGALLMSGKGARTVFVVARTSDAANTSILELNRAGSSSGSAYRVTPEIGVRINNGNALFANQPLDDQFHLITFQSPINGSTTSLRAWYDGIPVDPTEVAPRAIDTGSGGYRVGDGHVLGDAGFTGDIAEIIVYEDALTDTERAAVGLTLERKHGLKSWYVPSAEPVAVYLLAGQSNMVGQGDSEELSAPLNSTQGDVMAWMSSSVGWTPLKWGSGNLPTQFGPELGFGRAIADGDPDVRYALVKSAVNGTSLAVDWNPATGPVYADFVSTLAQASQRLTDLGIDYEVRGLVWMQGESDAMDEAMADAYQVNMESFIGEVRTLVGVPDLPVVMARIRGNMAPPFVYSLTVRMAQESVAAGDPNVKIVDTDSLTLHPDGVHYDTAGQLQLGTLFANAI